MAEEQSFFRNLFLCQLSLFCFQILKRITFKYAGPGMWAASLEPRVDDVLLIIAYSP